MLSQSIPLSLYVHFPWCVRKCPYCDFNSHVAPTDLPEKNYLRMLLIDLDNDLTQFEPRPLQSIFIGGGTPSLISGKTIAALLSALQQRFQFTNTIEITLEANPGTVEQQRFRDYLAAGVNRLSIGVQSFQTQYLKRLGRIHDATEANKAVQTAQHVGFENINIDLMYALPQQTPQDAIFDLKQAIQLQPSHISWYQLTIEPNTVFYKIPPTLPKETLIHTMEQQAHLLLNQTGFQRYEISAFCQSGKASQHNLNYWQFGDYLGIGAGAHSKLTIGNTIIRKQKYRQPLDYLNASKGFIAKENSIAHADLGFEFMLNALRLQQPIPVTLFTERTGLSLDDIQQPLQQAKKMGLLEWNEQQIALTIRGKQFSNDAMGLFLQNEVPTRHVPNDDHVVQT